MNPLKLPSIPQHMWQKSALHKDDSGEMVRMLFQSNINRNGCAHQPSRWSLRIITLHLLKEKRAALAFSNFTRTALDIKMQLQSPKYTIGLSIQLPPHFFRLKAAQIIFQVRYFHCANKTAPNFILPWMEWSFMGFQTDPCESLMERHVSSDMGRAFHSDSRSNCQPTPHLSRSLWCSALG